MPKISDQLFSVEKVDNGFIVRESWQEETVSPEGDTARTMYPEMRYQDKENIAQTSEQVKALFDTWVSGVGE